MFIVYTYFGRVISRHKIDGLHHDALESARESLLSFERETNQPAWVKLA